MRKPAPQAFTHSKTARPPSAKTNVGGEAIHAVCLRSCKNHNEKECAGAAIYIATVTTRNDVPRNYENDPPALPVRNKAYCLPSDPLHRELRAGCELRPCPYSSYPTPSQLRRSNASASRFLRCIWRDTRILLVQSTPSADGKQLSDGTERAVGAVRANPAVMLLAVGGIAAPVSYSTTIVTI